MHQINKCILLQQQKSLSLCFFVYFEVFWDDRFPMEEKGLVWTTVHRLSWVKVFLTKKTLEVMSEINFSSSSKYLFVISARIEYFRVVTIWSLFFCLTWVIYFCHKFKFFFFFFFFIFKKSAFFCYYFFGSVVTL